MQLINKLTIVNLSHEFRNQSQYEFDNNGHRMVWTEASFASGMTQPKNACVDIISWLYHTFLENKPTKTF